MARPINVLDHFKNSPNFMWRIAAHPCSVKPWLFVETMAPATLFLLIRVALPDFGDVIIDTGRNTGRAISVTQTRGKKKTTKRLVLKSKIKPNWKSGLNRFLWFPINIAEKVGFAYLLANFVNDAAVTWTTILTRCEECEEVFNPDQLGPLIKESSFNQQSIFDVFTPIPLDVELQNRAGWFSNISQVNLPFGEYTAIVGGKVSRILSGSIEMEARLRLTVTLSGIPVTFNVDSQRHTVEQDIETDFLLSANFRIPPFATGILKWEWRTVTAGLPLYNVGECFGAISGDSTCASTGADLHGA